MLQFEPEERVYGNLNMSLILPMRNGSDLASGSFLRSPSESLLIVHTDIGDHLQEDQIVAKINNRPLLALFKGVQRGLLHPGIQVWKGQKIDDVDPWDDPR
jgi:hypothetical protein